jgi:trimeric autotransporter adhesin
MTGRDRMVLIGVVVLVALGAAWMLVVSPERKKAGELGSKVAAAQTQLASAESAVSSARAAQSQYANAYAAIVNLGKAVPPSQEVPALIDQLAQASSQKSINFTSINSAASSTAAASTSSASTSSASTAAVAPTPLPFSFVFEGSYFDLEHLFNRLTAFATLTPSGELQVSGRLLTIQSVDLSPGVEAEGGKGTTNLTGSITATAYVMPAGEAPAPTGSATAAGAASPASSTGSAPTSPAIVKVNP